MALMIQLRPPTDADNYRVSAGRFGDRFYTDPLPADPTWPETSDDDIYPAVSTVKKATGQDWSKAMAKRLAKAPSQLVEIGNIPDEFERKERINLLSDAGLGQASGRGTIVHQHAEAKLAGRLPLYELSDEVKPYIRTFDAFLAAYQPTLVAVEFVAIHRSLNQAGVGRGNVYYGYGGTGDAVVEIDGKWWLVDWKSRADDSQHKAYPEEAAQVAAYGRADYWIVGTDENVHGAKRIPPPKLEGGLIVSIKSDSYECYPINLDKGFDYWTDLHAWWQARRSETKAIGRKWAPRVAPTSQLATGESCETNANITDQATTTGQPTPTDADTATSATAPTPTAPPADTGSDAPAVEPPTVASNKARFNKLSPAEKNAARESFKRMKLNPNNPATVGAVSRVIGEMERRPSLREMQEERAVERAVEMAAIGDDLIEAEGGAAPDEMINEARLMFEMALSSDGRKWTGQRVQEANAVNLPIRVSLLPSMKRAHVYLALCRWAAWRGQVERLLLQDEVEGNIEFTLTLNMVAPDTSDLTLGHRLALLSPEDAEKFATVVQEIVESETGDELVTEPETQPEIKPTETEE